jgi:Flp pilus assembly protein TadD
LSNIKLHLVLAPAFDQLHETSSAEAEWRAVLALDQQSSVALDSLSSDLLLDNDCAGIITLLEDPMILGQRTPKQSLNLGLAYTRTNQLEPAATVLRDGLNTSPDSLPIANALADALVKLGRAQEAGDVLDLELAQHPGDHDTEIHFLQALIAVNSSRAPGFARKLLLASPQDWMLLYLNGVIETRGGDLQKARSYLEESITLNPDFAVSREALGVILIRQNELPGAKEQLEKAIELGDDNAEVKQDLSKVMQALGAAK